MKKEKERNHCCRRCLLGTLIYVILFIVILLVVIFGIAPVVFKYSVGIQKAIIFPTWVTPNENFSDVDSFGLDGVKNFYINVTGNDGNITIGVWHILPSNLLSESVRNDHYNYDGILENPNINIVLYLHGNGGVRSVPLNIYKVLREHFQIISIDYRGYGDSTKAEITENGIVNDTVQIYKWLAEKANSKIFIWGHSLGTGVGTHTVAELKAQNYTPTPAGLILEAPFSSVTDVMELHGILQFFKWLPWFESMFIEPIIENGMGFNSTNYIANVDCPILILHAKDDDIIPYELATKLYKTAISQRNNTAQGDVTYHLFDAHGYKHMELYLVPDLSEIIRKFVSASLKFNEAKLKSG